MLAAGVLVACWALAWGGVVIRERYCLCITQPARDKQSVYAWRESVMRLPELGAQLLLRYCCRWGMLPGLSSTIVIRLNGRRELDLEALRGVKWFVGYAVYQGGRATALSLLDLPPSMAILLLGFGLHSAHPCCAPLPASASFSAHC